MCGIIGIVSTKFIKKELIQNLVIQSKIRGQHATGMSYIQDNGVKGTDFITKIIPESAEKFEIKNVNTKMLIAHTRYSTSSLEYNQPINFSEHSIVHNGVITQVEFDKWDQTYRWTSKNDSEHILKTVRENKNPIFEYPRASIAYIHLNYFGKIMKFARNGKRPLYYSEENDLICIASTKDILKRAGLDNINQCKSCDTYYIKADTNSLQLGHIPTYYEHEDLQCLSV
tara:strand:- start:655 stop:1338 length:684 start_codon:yes stop_codon:yes gene_type:complete